MFKAFRSIGPAVVVLALCASSAGASPEEAYRASLEGLKAGDYDRAIASAHEALGEPTASTEAGPRAALRATALELIARYELETNRLDLGVRHLTEALALTSAMYASDHPRVLAIKREIREAERRRY
jgi:hypothetical protein